MIYLWKSDVASDRVKLEDVLLAIRRSSRKNELEELGLQVDQVASLDVDSGVEGIGRRTEVEDGAVDPSQRSFHQLDEFLKKKFNLKLLFDESKIKTFDCHCFDESFQVKSDFYVQIILFKFDC